MTMAATTLVPALKPGYDSWDPSPMAWGLCDVFDELFDNVTRWVLSNNERQETIPIVSQIVERFVQHIKSASCYPEADTAYCLRLAMNTPTYYKYYGTFAHQILVLMFQPMIFSHRIHNKICLNRFQCDDALKVLGCLLAAGYLDMIKDYYEKDPTEYLEGMEEVYAGQEEVLLTIKRFKLILRHGHNIPGIVKSVFAKVRAKQRAKDKWAVSVFENHWLPIVLSPDTRPGQAMLAKRAARWYAALYSHV